MTSVNLVSPEDNGHLYSVRFKEPLHYLHRPESVYLIATKLLH